jgi:nucleoside 2-deoxyribosyltransferase
MPEKIYLAGPWFNPIQVRRYELILTVLADWSIRVPGRELYVPRENVCPPDADLGTRQRVYLDNLMNLADASAVVAITDEKDIGTIYELGYAARLRDERFARSDEAPDSVPKLYGVALDLGSSPFNLMLAAGLDATFRTVRELRAFLLEGVEPPPFVGTIE